MKRAADVTSADGTRLAVYEGGNPDGPPILFLHGFSQASLCWQGQFDDPALAATFRLVAVDIRGHGASDQPLDAARYTANALFAEDIHAVITGLGLHRPVLVGWSYAGRLISDYVQARGCAALGGINFVAARSMDDARFNGPGTAHIRAMIGDDLSANLVATRAFLRTCFATPQPQDAFETALAYTMAVPAKIRAAHIRRPPNDGASLAAMTLPVLITQGTADLLVLPGLADLTAEKIPHARLSVYENIGHAPFVEDRKRFNSELARFATPFLTNT